MRHPVATGLAILGVVFVLWGVALMVMQLLYWLKTGGWPSISALNLFLPLGSENVRVMRLEPYDLMPTVWVGAWHWLQYPSDWFGVNKLVLSVLTLLPLSLTIVLCGVAICFASVLIRPNEKPRRHAQA
jgi:hypothetical protein